MKYNSNIFLLRKIENQSEANKQEPNSYYALMVEDVENKHRTDIDFFDRKLGWIGLERTSDGRIYISNKFHNCFEPSRGTTWLVAVHNPQLCCELTY